MLLYLPTLFLVRSICSYSDVIPGTVYALRFFFLSTSAFWNNSFLMIIAINVTNTFDFNDSVVCTRALLKYITLFKLLNIFSILSRHRYISSALDALMSSEVMIKKNPRFLISSFIYRLFLWYATKYPF